MSKYLLLFLLLALVHSKIESNEVNYIEPDEVIYYFQHYAQIPDNFYSDSIQHIKKILNRYVYLDIIQNPPQPEGREEYFTKVNLLDELDKVDINQTNFYKFYQDVLRIISKAHDGHISIKFNQIESHQYKMGNVMYFSPMKYAIDKNKDVYAKLLTDFSEETLRKVFGDDVVDNIKKNENQKILTINGQNPIDYINNFYDDFSFLKNPHAKFTYALRIVNKGKLSSNPLNVESFKNVTINYDNSETQIYNYLFVENTELINYFSQKLNIDPNELSSFDEENQKSNHDFLNIFDSVQRYI